MSPCLGEFERPTTVAQEPMAFSGFSRFGFSTTMLGSPGLRPCSLGTCHFASQRCLPSPCQGQGRHTEKRIFRELSNTWPCASPEYGRSHDVVPQSAPRRKPKSMANSFFVKKLSLLYPKPGLLPAHPDLVCPCITQNLVHPQNLLGENACQKRGSHKKNCQLVVARAELVSPFFLPRDSASASTASAQAIRSRGKKKLSLSKKKKMVIKAAWRGLSIMC